MSDAIALIADLEKRGIELVVADGRLALRGPKEQLTAELIERVRSYTPELRRRLIEEVGDRGVLAASQQPKLDNDSVGPAWLASSAMGRDVFDEEPDTNGPTVRFPTETQLRPRSDRSLRGFGPRRKDWAGHLRESGALRFGPSVAWRPCSTPRIASSRSLTTSSRS